MADLNLQALREIAEKAGQPYPAYPASAIKAWKDADIEYRAAFNPATVLALLAEISRVQQAHSEIFQELVRVDADRQKLVSRVAELETTPTVNGVNASKVRRLTAENRSLRDRIGELENRVKELQTLKAAAWEGSDAY